VSDESSQMSRRHVNFDMNELTKTAAASVGARECVSVEKCPDGLYNKAFIFTMDDGRQVIGKIPNPNAGIPHFTTASEVATLDFVGTSFIFYLQLQSAPAYPTVRSYEMFSKHRFPKSMPGVQGRRAR
jgi:hypothetical protein